MKTLILAATLVSLAWTPAFAQTSNPFGPSGTSSAKITEVARTISLSPSQRRALRTIKDSLRKAEVKSRAAIEIVRIDLSRELDSANPSRAKLGGFIDKISQFEAQSRKAKVFASLSIRKLLNKQQWSQLQAMHKHRGHAGNHHQHMRHREARAEARALRTEARKLARESRKQARKARKQAARDVKRAHRDRKEAEAHRRQADKGSIVKIDSTPTNVKVYIDGKRLGTTPMTLRLRPGRHSVRLKKKGYKSIRKTIVVKSGALTTLQVVLESSR